MKAIASAAVVVVAGALLGSFLGKALALAFPQGRVHDLFATQIGPLGLPPVHLDLKIVDLTFGCLFRFNVMTVAGVLLAAFLYKRILR